MSRAKSNGPRHNTLLTRKRIGEATFQKGFEDFKEIHEAQGFPVRDHSEKEGLESFLLMVYENGSAYFRFPKAKVLVKWFDSQFTFTYAEKSQSTKPAISPPPAALMDEEPGMEI